MIYFLWQSSGIGTGERKIVGDDEVSEVQELYRMTIFVILRQNDHFETFALLFHQLF